MSIPAPLKSIIKDSLQFFLSKRYFIWRSKKNTSYLALTFDDGPDLTNTPIILDILYKNNILGTFFVVGEKAIRCPDILKRIVAEGHELGNHTYSHKKLPFLGKDRIKQEILGNQELIFKITKVYTNIFRPPQTRINLKSLLILIMIKQTIVLWSVSSEDYLDQGTETILNNVNDKIVQGGDILLFHDQSIYLKDSLQKIINNLKGVGFNFCTVSQLINC